MKQTEPERANLEAIFRECGKDLGAYFTRRHGQSETANDLVQESFLQLARQLRSGLALRSPRAYLFGIARHVSMAFLRKQRGAAESLDTVSEQVVSAEPDTRLEAARELIASLPGLQREILDLRFTHGLSYAEMATALDVPAGTVRSRLHNALGLLRERLEADSANPTLPVCSPRSGDSPSPVQNHKPFMP